jgi:hypothetical protein
MLHKVWGQDFDGCSCFAADCENTLIEMFAATVWQIVASHGGDDHVFETESECSLGDSFWFI